MGWAEALPILGAMVVVGTVGTIGLEWLAYWVYYKLGGK